VSLRNTQPRLFSPKGVGDAFDEDHGFPGTCLQLKNLIRDTRQEDSWVCRPAAVRLTQFQGFTTPGQISALTVINGIAYGMLATGRNAGKDEPFAFNIAGGVFLTVSNVLADNVPFTQPTTGNWTPPTMALVGARLFVTHPGFAGTANFFGWFDLSSLGAPAWNAGNTTGTPLPFVPVAVAQYMDRAWFAVNLVSGYSACYFTDTGTLNLTSATQILTFGDNTPISALHGLPFKNQLGGLIQSLIVFKGSPNGVYNMYQITGDSSQATQAVVAGSTTITLSSGLSVNALNCATTCLAPNSIVATPKGLFFVAPDGLRLMDWEGNVSPPIGGMGKGVNAVFYQIVSPSRICAATNSNLIRISFDDILDAGIPTEEYWFDLERGTWSGAHTFPADLIASYGDSFVLAPHGMPGQLWQSDSHQTAASGFVEAGAQMVYSLDTAFVQDPGGINECSVIETSVIAGMPSATKIMVTAYDEQGSPLDSAEYTAAGAASIWGSFVWGQANWAAASNYFGPRRIDWHRPLVYRRLRFSITGDCASGLRFAGIWFREERLGYSQMRP